MRQPLLTEHLKIRPLADAPYDIFVSKRSDRIDIENYAIVNEEQFYGASRDLEKLEKLKTAEFKLMPGCTFITHWTGSSFKGRVEAGKGCMVVRNGRNTYLDSEFEIDRDKFTSHDRGRDPETDAHVWGAQAGPFEFTRRASFAGEIQI